MSIPLFKEISRASHGAVAVAITDDGDILVRTDTGRRADDLCGAIDLLADFGLTLDEARELYNRAS